ncbi:YqzE family protein [Cohnella endophytica]|uniref:YqzE family protein n=1 Tax=Cohnella endophytica TaxID=2419778 RepID=A0A494XZC7_9BACL|nr:YqzE family protein [Cohnella endophytica]RKP54389.1 YqzE family protein [Cohnella endophytica]
MDGNEYVKYVTERVVSYMERPEDEDAEESAPRMLSREPWLTRWFGVAPLGIMMWWGNRVEKRNKTHPEVRSVDSSTYR